MCIRDRYMSCGACPLLRERAFGMREGASAMRRLWRIWLGYLEARRRYHRDDAHQIAVNNLRKMCIRDRANHDFTSDYEGDVYTLFEDRPTLRLRLEVRCPDAGYRLSRCELDREHGSAYDRWVEMRSPGEPEKADVDYLLEAAALQRSVSYVRAREGKLALEDVYKRQGHHQSEQNVRAGVGAV